MDAAPNPHVLVIPFPAQGHINPALSFSNCLASKGILITFIITTKISKTAKLPHSTSITIATISDGSEQVKEIESIEGSFKRFEAVLSHNLSIFIDKQMASYSPPKLIVYDSTMPWVLDIARGKCLLGASFFTQSCAVSSIFYHMKQGLLRFPYQEDFPISLPSLPALTTKDLPGLSEFMDPNQTIAKHLANQFLNVEKADWIFFNTFDKLEKEILDWMASLWPIKTVGPTFLLMQEDKNVSNKKNHMMSLLEPKNDAYKEWLDSRETSSVVYVSFGSIASLGKEQMEELAFGLVMSNCHFLWVVRSSDADKLPHDFTNLASEKGLIVEWCHQLEVLTHRAVACFMTHCGWNSTLEALSNGVPLIAMARWADQTTNSKFIEDVWGVGVRVEHGQNGVIGREEIAMRIKQVVDGEKKIELKANAFKWKGLANDAIENGGTSANNIEDFVSKLV